MYSSFTYRIAAIQLLGRVLVLARTDQPDPHQLDALETSLANWTLHLPKSKKVAVDKDGKVDEMLFQAQMIVAAWVPPIRLELVALSDFLSQKYNPAAQASIPSELSEN